MDADDPGPGAAPGPPPEWDMPPIADVPPPPPAAAPAAAPPPPPAGYVPPPPPYGWPAMVPARPTGPEGATAPGGPEYAGGIVVSERAQREHRKSSAIVGFVVAAVVFVTAFGLGHNGGLGGSSNSSSPPAIVSSNSNNGSVDTSGVSDKVSAAVVNINTTLSGGGEAAGSGIVLTADGTVLTNNHVIDGATDIQVEINGNRVLKEAKIVGYDTTDDIAVIKIKNVSNLKTVSLGDSSRVAVSDAVIAIGNTLGKGGSPTVTSGIVSGLNKEITVATPTAGTRRRCGT